VLNENNDPSRDDSWLADETAAAMRDFASTVTEAPPLRLTAGFSTAGERRRIRGVRHWWSWGAPLAAAAAVVVFALVLVFVKDIPNEGPAPISNGMVPVNTSPSTAGPGGTPRYYAAIKAVAQTSPKIGDDVQYGSIVVGDALTGKTLATFAPPADTAFESVTAAADDLTFIAYAVTSSTASFLPTKGATLSASWYELRLTPGAADPVRLSRLPIAPWSWANKAESYNAPAPGQIWATALSQSGQELAVADTPYFPVTDETQNWQEVQVLSVATGRLLHDWVENDPNARFATVLGGTGSQASALTWIDGDQALALATSRELSSGAATATVSRLDVTGSTTDSLAKDSTVLWSGKLTWSDGSGCYAVGEWPPLLSADGKTVSCTNYAQPKSGASPFVASFVTDPLRPGTSAATQSRFDYQVTSPLDQNGKPLAGGADTSLLWVSPSGGTLIAVWHYIENRPPATGVHFEVISHGKLTPLRIPTSLATAASIAF
jgi:hypothetical protein